MAVAPAAVAVVVVNQSSDRGQTTLIITMYYSTVTTLSTTIYSVINTAQSDKRTCPLLTTIRGSGVTSQCQRYSWFWLLQKLKEIVPRPS